MRFCPFCSAENVDEAASCASCSRRLPPLPPRRAGSAAGRPPTGIVMPPRANSPTNAPRPATATSPPPTPARKTGTTLPPPIPSPTTPVQGAAAIVPTSAPAADSTTVNANRESAPALPPPPAVDSNSSRSSLLDVLNPSPAAQRREAPPLDAPIVGDRRGANASSSMSPLAFSRPPERPKSSSVPPPSPPERTKPASVPPPLPQAAQTIAPPSLEIVPRSSEPTTGVTPPPTRIQRPEALVDRPFTPPKVLAVPEIPEPGLVQAAKYAYQFGIARWQRRGAIKQLGLEIKQDTEALDQVLGALGRTARGAKVEGRVFSAENTAITAAEERVAQLGRDSAEVEARKAEENTKFVDIERERNEKLVEAERLVEEAQRELQHLEAQRRSLRDKRKELDRRQKAYLKNADDQERQASAAPLGDQRQEYRRAAEGHRKEAAALEPDKQDLDRRITQLERPINEATARLDAAKAELDAAKRSLNDAREGHTHRLAELDAEQKRKSREVSLAESEIARRLVTLGTLVNLNRIEDPQFAELYQRIDRLRGAITARTTEIEKLTAEREAYDRGTLVRGLATIGGAFLALIALIVILKAVL